MQILKSPAQAEITIKKSIFLAEAFYMDDAAGVKECIKAQKAQYRDARHVVHAFVIGKKGEVFGCSDDGEPAGTAGQPALAVLKGSGITHILVTITRWFGGVLLGTGGLVKAYTGAVQAVLACAELEPLIEKKTFSFACAYEDYERIVRSIANLPVTVTDTVFTQAVQVRGSIPCECSAAFAACITSVTKGAVSVLFGE